MMLRDVSLALLVGLLLAGTGSGQASVVHYSIVAPSSFRPSSVYNLTATCYNVTENVNLTVQLWSWDNTVLAEKNVALESEVTQTVSLLIPDDVPQNSYYLKAEGRGGVYISQSRYVSVLRKTLSIFVQTDKVLYKPGQTVLYRVVVVNSDLKPYQEFLDIVIYDIAGNRIMQLLDQQSESGVISQRLKLSDQTPLGQWKIVVTVRELTYTKTFEVDEYVLPKFEVTVLLPSYYLVNLNRRNLQENLLATVMAKYTYGQPVKGRANVKIQLNPYSDWDYTVYSQITKDVQLVDGKADLTFTIDELLTLVPNPYYYYPGYTPDLWQWLYYRTILVVASVNETVTGIVLPGKATVACSSVKYQLKFLESSPENFKPGLLYTAFLQLSQLDGKPPDASDILLPEGGYRTVSVQVTMNYPYKCTRYGESIYVPSTYTYLDVAVKPSGYVTVPLTIDFDALSVSLQASFYANSTQNYIYAYKYLSIFRTTDFQAIRISFISQDGVIRPLETAMFNVTTTEPITTFQYQVLAKGSILLSGNMVGEASKEHLLSIWISEDVAMKLAPNARIIVWFITASGEIIVDGIWLTVSDYFANKVSLSFDRNSTTPSNNVSLTVNAYQGSYVGLLAVDQSVLLLRGRDDITQTMISDELKGYDSFGYYYPYYIYGSDSQSLLSNAGLFLLTDGYFYQYGGYYYPTYGTSTPSMPMGTFPETTQTFASMPMPTSSASQMPQTTEPSSSTTEPPTPGGESEGGSSKPRIDFPETWIWADAVAGPDGRFTFETSVPDTITSWVASAFAISQIAGLGLAANPAKLTVFKQFFVSPNLPYSVIRGEEFELELTVFNYMSSSLDVVVTLQQSVHYEITGSNSQVAQVESNDAVSLYFWIVPISLGQIPIDISAQSPVAGDAIRAMLLVKPEGVQQQYSTSVYIQLSSSAPTYQTTLNVALPPVGKLVPGSQYIEITAIGDLMGPSIQGLDNLLQMPYGCGEQNMLNFAPDVYILNYLSISGQLTADIKNKALGFLNAGYQAELTYQRFDGSFSAFGNGDTSGSVWLSSFVINSFHEAKDFIPVDDGKIAQTMRWIINRQATNGSFAEPPYGRVIHVDMQGGSSQGLALTAYVLISLLENQNNSQIGFAYANKSIAAARKYLEDQISTASSDPYVLSIIAYALVLSDSSKVSEVLQMLEALAKTEAGTRHWEKSSDSSGGSQSGWSPPYVQARSVNIEMTSYVLLTYCELNDLSKSLPIAKWIAAQRNAYGGFSSTQDTVMALKALAEFSSMILGPADERNIQVSLETDTVQHNFSPITSETSILLQSYELPSNTTEVSLSASGRGAVLIQLNVQYNVYETDDDSWISLTLNSQTDGKKILVKLCSKWEKNEGSGMVVIEIYQLTGFKVSNLNDLKKQGNGLIKRVESKEDKVVLYLDELTLYETCINVMSEKLIQVNNVKDAPIKVYPYYDPSGGRTVFYGLSSSQDVTFTDTTPSPTSDTTFTDTTPSPTPDITYTDTTTPPIPDTFYTDTTPSPAPDITYTDSPQPVVTEKTSKKPKGKKPK